MEHIEEKGMKASKMTVVKAINLKSGIKSSRLCAFNEPNWGMATRTHLATIRAKLRNDSFAKIMERARAQMNVNHQQNGEGSDVEDPHHDLVDLTDSED